MEQGLFPILLSEVFYGFTSLAYVSRRVVTHRHSATNLHSLHSLTTEVAHY